MSETLLSSRNLAFELYEVLDAEALTHRPRFAEHSRETFDAALGTAARATNTSRSMRMAQPR